MMKLNELLKLNKDAVMPDKDRVSRLIRKRRSKPARMIAICSSVGAVCLIGVVVLLSFFLRTGEVLPAIVNGASNIISAVEPLKASALGVDVNSPLKITTTEEVDLVELKARLSVSPSAEFRLKKAGNCTYEMQFEKELEGNALYNVNAVYNGKTVYRWAFQTESVFKVTSVFPDGESHVPLDSAIEVTFSHTDVRGFEEAFEISPKVEGTFEHYGRTWAFVPTAPLEPAALYTVKIKKSVLGPGSMGLEEDYCFSFSTAEEGSFAYLIYQQNQAADTFLVNEAPIAAICYNQTDVSAAQVKVFSFGGSKAYAEAYKQYVRNGWVSPEIQSTDAVLFSEFKATPALTKDYNNVYDQAAFINYPEPLPLGYYYAEIQVGGYKVYQLLQSTTLSVYTVTTNGDYTVWVNDTETSDAIAGRKVMLEGFRDGKTNNVGVVNFKGAETASQERVLQVENGDHPYVAILTGDGADREVSLKNDYYSFVSVGSNLYRATDTAKIFGAILPRKSSGKIPKTVTLRCDAIDAVVEADVLKNGAFTAEIPLKNTASTYANVDLYIDDVCLSSAYITIADYQLPLYEVTVVTDRVAYLVGQSVQFTATVTYMDGTPASGVPVSSVGKGLDGVTDENGCLTGSFPAEKQNQGNYYVNNAPEIQSLDFAVDNGTDEYYGGTAGYLVFESAEFMTASYADGVLTVTANQVNFDLANQIDRDRIYQDGQEEEQYLGASASMLLQGELHEISYQKKPAGTTYDAINKKVVYAWEYEEIDTKIRNLDVTVTDGKGTLGIPEKPDVNRCYYVLLRSDAGTVQCYLTDYNYSSEGRNRFNMTADKFTADIGENVELLVRDGSNNEVVNGGSVLYTAVSGELIESLHGSSGRYDLKFKKEYAPDVLIHGAYFDGKHVYDLGSQWLEYDLEESRLTVEMEKDQLQYRPGDSVTLKFKVTDRNGKPVQATLNVSVLDRALYLISGQPEDPLYSLYGSRCFSTPVYTTVSYREFMPGAQLFGEGGGGGEPGRGNFEDTPYFDTMTTNKEGEATVSFTLPDTLTEWKVVGRAVFRDVQAGMELFSLRSTQDYFAQVSLGDTLKTTDDCTIAVKADGILHPLTAQSSVEVGLTDRDGNEIKTLTGTAEKGKYLYLNFGNLAEGLYTAYIQAECGELTDGIIKTFAVLDTQTAVWVHRQEEVGDGLTMELDPRRGNVILTVTDVERAFWQQAMARLRSCAGDRVDQVLGQYLADEFYSSGRWMDAETLDYAVIRSYMDHSGVKLFRNYETSDLRVSAKLAAVAPEFCDKDTLKNGFELYLNDRYAARIDVLISYFGLAALGEPVLGDLQTVYSTQTELSLEETAYLALAFAYAGDYDTANYLFETQLKDALSSENGEIWADVDGSVEEDLTGCCALLSNRLNLEESEGLISYIVNCDTSYTLLNLELISYLKDRVTDLSGENKVTVATGDGRNETYTYQRMDEVVLTLSPAQAAKIRISDVQGHSAVSYAYSGTAEDLKNIGQVNGAVGLDCESELSLGTETELILTVEVPEDYELPMLDLVLPAGLRLENGTVFAGEWDYSIVPEYDHRRINVPLQNGSNTVSLWVRGALPGTYEIEPALITNARNHHYIATESIQISVAGT